MSSLRWIEVSIYIANVFPYMGGLWGVPEYVLVRRFCVNIRGEQGKNACWGNNDVGESRIDVFFLSLVIMSNRTCV